MNSLLSTLSTPRFAVRNGVATMQQERDQLFDRLFNCDNATEMNAGAWYAPLAVWEEDERVHLEVEMPGIAKGDVELTILKGRLHIVAERKMPQDQRKYQYNERRYGRFERVINLPDAIDLDAIQAELHDGVLSITLLKCPAAQPKRISVAAA